MDHFGVSFAMMLLNHLIIFLLNVCSLNQCRSWYSMNCQFLLPLRFLLFLYSPPGSTGFPFGKIGFLIQSLKKIVWKIIWHSILKCVLWKLWIARNYQLFNSVSSSPQCMTSKIKTLVVECVSMVPLSSLPAEAITWMGKSSLGFSKKN